MAEWTIKKDGHHYYFVGTGAFINANDVLTNQHVVERCDKIGIRNKNGFISGKVIGTVKRNGFMDNTKEIGDDIAIIRTSANTSDFAYIRRKNPNAGDLEVAPEYTNKAGEFSIRSGKLTDVGHYIRFTGLGRKGNSGSPVYNKNGYLIGIQHSGGFKKSIFDKQENVGTNIYHVVEFLQKSKIPYFVEPKNAESIMDTDRFKKSFAVGIMCGN